MAAGRREELRLHAISQARVLFGDFDVEAFLERGDFGDVSKKPLDPQLQANVDRQIQRIIANGGKFVLEN